MDRQSNSSQRNQKFIRKREYKLQPCKRPHKRRTSVIPSRNNTFCFWRYTTTFPRLTYPTSLRLLSLPHRDSWNVSIQSTMTITTSDVHRSRRLWQVPPSFPTTPETTVTENIRRTREKERAPFKTDSPKENCYLDRILERVALPK